ncbi:MAG: THxN family PEP-CTERM protein [Gammaproteobacteria bacterium]
MKKIVTTLSFAGALLAAPLAATAAPMIVNWDYTVTTNWVPSATQFNSQTAGTTTVSPTVISWGATGGDYTNQSAGPLDARSALVISNTPATGTAITNGAIEDTSLITHYNNILDNRFKTLTRTELITTLTLNANPGGGAPAGSPFSKTFNVEFIETANTDPCFAASSGTIPCDDIFVLGLNNLLDSFMFEGVKYNVQIIGNLGLLPDSACLAAGAPTGCFGLQTHEAAITTAPFAFRITAQIPEPGILALLGIGLAGVGFASRRRSSAV